MRSSFLMFYLCYIVKLTAVYPEETVFSDIAYDVNAPWAIQHGGPAEELGAECEYKPYKWPEKLLQNLVVSELLETVLLFFVAPFWSFFFRP